MEVSLCERVGRRAGWRERQDRFRDGPHLSLIDHPSSPPYSLPTDIQAEAVPLILGGGDVLAAAEALDLTRGQLVTLAKNSLLASFVTVAERAPWLDRLEQVVAVAAAAVARAQAELRELPELSV